MRFDDAPDEQALRKQLREYFATLAPADESEMLEAPGKNAEHFRQVIKQLGADGWLGFGWPVEYGGQGRSAVEQYVVFDEIQRAGVPFPFVTVNTVGPTIMRFGTDEQKAKYLPKILAGELNVAIGYTEPAAGTDLASLRTTARLDGDEWVINGSKVFTSGANQADLVWLACRTEPDAKKHQGLSMIMVPTDSPGFRYTPIVTVGDIVTTATYYDDVHVPAENIVGERGGGWRMITTQLNHERVGLAALGGPAWRAWGEVRAWAATTPVRGGDGSQLIGDLPWVRADLADCFARLEAMKLINWRMVQAVHEDNLQPAQASTAKFYGTETHVYVYRKLLGILGAGGWLRGNAAGAALQGRIERLGRSAQINTFGGGVNEIQREIVAATELQMARRAR
ncbi:MAG: acyl-CoA dehydrogenase family protein [Frankiaceae bacterium]|nr:acyl-CoA dehydrogenase family protein [Frankiaceae bacterium]MBV9871051.1 acyl-CoA dehydrogenase family protein [Frankiaceae bacterium]